MIFRIGLSSLRRRIRNDKGEGVNPSTEAEGSTPSEQPTGRRLFEARGSSDLYGDRLKALP